jgi:mono/diheme cytochrome c family protein
VSPRIQSLLKTVGIAVAAVVAAAAGYVDCTVANFNESLDKVYYVPLPAIARSADPAVLARGKHLVETLGGCASSHCHGANLAGGEPIVMGPLGTMVGPNITAASLGAAYSDGELARLLRDGIKKDGRTVRFMPVQDIAWFPDADVTAIVSYLRVVPAVDRECAGSDVRMLAKILDRSDQVTLDVARRIDHQKREAAPAPAPTAEYGSFITRACTGCHGKTFGGGRLPGGPSTLPVPLNLTPDPSGLQGWTFADFEKLMRTGTRKNGKVLDPFMPIEALKELDDTEMHAAWAYLQSLPPRPFGSR